MNTKNTPVLPVWKNADGWCIGSENVATLRKAGVSGTASFERFGGPLTLCVQEDGVNPTIDVVAELLRRHGYTVIAPAPVIAKEPA